LSKEVLEGERPLKGDAVRFYQIPQKIRSEKNARNA
jgi:hypothetical protein